MRIVIEIRDELISKMKYVILALFILFWIWFVYSTQLELVNSNIPHWETFLLLAAIFAIYMAINLWANDVANNMWPAVWSKAITLGWAIFIAVIFEASWALIAWWDVVDTIKWDIIKADMIWPWSVEFIAIMLSTMLWAALWVNIATFFKAPVSITHSIFWGLIWAWITSAWLWIVNWWKVWAVASAWVVAILMWWFLATWLYISIRKTILKRKNMWEAAKHMVPIYVWLMSWIFTAYLIMKGFKKNLISSYQEWNWFFDFLLTEVPKKNKETWEVLMKIITDTPTTIIVWIWVSILTYISLLLYYKSREEWFFQDNRDFVRWLFNIPLIFAVALLSFAHWANDVANAIWPLAAIYDAVVSSWDSLWKVWIPPWIMILWAVSLSLWLAVFGWRLIKTVWNEITKLSQIQAYCVALSAAITVIIASAMSLPVSTTQIAIGWVFGIWLYREYLKRKKWKNKIIIKKSMIKSILLSWIITLPVAWIIASITYLIIIFLSK